MQKSNYSLLREEVHGILQRSNGTPTTITEVLLSLAKKDPTNGIGWYAIDDDGKLLFCQEYKGGWGVHADVATTGIRFDLSRPLSATENDEACGDVLNILQ